MRQVEVYAVGRLRDRGLRALCDDYYRRSASFLTVKERELEDLDALQAAIPPRSVIVVLDERGKQLGSRAFAEQLQRRLQSSAARIVFVIGGADGVSASLRDRADLVLSLGQMTFAHRIVRLIFAEQLYRAVTILQGHPYHRD